MQVAILCGARIRAPWTKAPWTKAPKRPKLKVFSTLFLGKNKSKQCNYIRIKLGLEEFNKRVNFDSETLTSTSREPPGVELRISTRAKQATNRNNVAT